MPEGHLHAVVDAIAAAGSQQLARRAADGAPVPFDLVEVPSSGAGAPLFSYRPRTRDFVEEHVDALRGLAAWPSAVNVLAGFDGLGDYLLSSGEPHVPIDARERADLVLRVLLAQMHEETGDFLHTPERAAAATQRLARSLYGGRVEGMVVVPLLGVRIDAERIALEDGLELVRDDVLDDLPREARSPVRTRPGTVVVVRALEDPARSTAMAQARPRLRALLTALRLYDQPAPALAPVAWSKMRGDGWSSHPFIGTSARASGILHIRAQDEASMRGFCALIAGRTAAPGVAWAQRRFELACERPDHGEALTDVLLGLRALLESDHVGSGTLADRLAALCAGPGEWESLRDRVESAETVELSLMQGREVDPARVRAITLELRGHLRALLRDIACGHLPADLVPVAEHHLLVDDEGEPLLAPGFTGAFESFDDEDHPVLVTDTRDGQGAVSLVGPAPSAPGPVDSPPVATAPALAAVAPAAASVATASPAGVPAPKPAATTTLVDGPSETAVRRQDATTAAVGSETHAVDETRTRMRRRRTVAPPPARYPAEPPRPALMPLHPSLVAGGPGAAPVDRERMPDGGSFEEAFVRSLDGPSPFR